MANRKKTGKDFGTQAKFKLKGGFKPIRKFDDSDLAELRENHKSVEMNQKLPETGAVVPRSVPSHLLMISILEHLCYMYTRSGIMAHKLFKVLCEQLTKLRVVSPLSCIDEMSGIRAHYRSSVHNMIQAAMNDLYKNAEILPLPPTSEFGNIKLNHQLTRVRTEELINMQTSRYNDEFLELDKLGKGGFGSVYKVQNRLDGRNYAVKKIKFKHKKPEHLLKVLKEVKALASFQHTNIVGYNAAWLEYDFPSTNSNRSHSSPDYSVSQDNSFSCIPEASNVDVQFRLDSGSEDEFDNEHGRIIHKHYNTSKCTITEITEYSSNNKIFQDKFKKFRVKANKSVLKTLQSTIADNSTSKAFLENIPESVIHSTQNFSKDENSENLFLESEKNVSRSESSDIIFLDDNDDEHRSSSSKDIENSKNLSKSSHKYRDSLIIHNRHSERLDVKGSTAALSPEIEIPKAKVKTEENTTPNASPKDRLVPFRRSISAEPIQTTGIVQDFHDYSDDNFPYHATISLYIQMELCEQTLQMWINDRNNHLNNVEDLKDVKDDSIKIIHQILTGVDYIHSLGLIHRDLKPRNIFLLGDSLHVKIGDFGLATEDVLGGEVKDTVLTPSPDIKAYFKYDNLTSGVGTYLYAAPEQLLKNYYDSKCDIYSIGVILFELFQVFKTEMERHVCIKSLRDGVIPDNLLEYWPDVAKALQQMISIDAADRPTARYLLESQLFLSKDQVRYS